jgi:hypothetical protein
MAGEKTGEFGYWLKLYLDLNFPQYRVFYDHGISKSNNVGKIQGCIGNIANSKTILTEVDLMIVEQNNNIKLLIEIEDKSILGPKIIIGTVFTTIMCNQFAFGVGNEKQYFPIIPETKLIIAGYYPSKGSKREQLEQVIEPKIKEYESLTDCIRLDNIDFVFKEDISKTIDALKKHVIGTL